MKLSTIPIKPKKSIDSANSKIRLINLKYHRKTIVIMEARLIFTNNHKGFFNNRMLYIGVRHLNFSINIR